MPLDPYPPTIPKPGTDPNKPTEPVPCSQPQRDDL